MSLGLGKWVLLGAPVLPEGQAGLRSPDLLALSSGHRQLAERSWRACSGLPSLPSALSGQLHPPHGRRNTCVAPGFQQGHGEVRGSLVGLGGVRRNLWARPEMGEWMTRLQEEAGRPLPRVPAGTRVRCGGQGAVWTGTDSLCRGLPHQAGTHSKNPQCLVDSQAQAQAQGSRHRDAVVAATERHVPCAAVQAAVQSHTAPGLQLELLVQPPGPASKHSLGALGRSVCRRFSGVFRVQGPADMPRGLFPPPPPPVETSCCSRPSALSTCSHASCTLPLSARQPPAPSPPSAPGPLPALGYFVSRPAPLPSIFSDPSSPPPGGEDG